MADTEWRWLNDIHESNKKKEKQSERTHFPFPAIHVGDTPNCIR